jgi:hypothetical protein
LSLSRLLKDALWKVLNLDDNKIKSEGFTSLIYALKDNEKLQELSIGGFI